MLQYASADLIGITVTNERGTTRVSTWRALHAEKVNVSKVVNSNSTTSARWIAAAWLIVTDASPRDFQRALFQLRTEGKRETTSALALRIQKIERANARTTKEVDTESRIDESQYDGFVISRREREAMTMNAAELEIADEWHTYNWSQSRGIVKRGYNGPNVKRLPAIPSARLCKIDPTFIPIRAMLMRERSLNVQFGVSHVKYGPAF